MCKMPFGKIFQNVFIAQYKIIKHHDSDLCIVPYHIIMQKKILFTQTITTRMHICKDTSKSICLTLTII